MIKIWFKKDQLVLISQMIKGPISSYWWESGTYVFSPVLYIIALRTKIIFVKKQIILIKLSYIMLFTFSRIFYLLFYGIFKLTELLKLILSINNS